MPIQGLGSTLYAASSSGPVLLYSSTAGPWFLSHDLLCSKTISIKVLSVQSRLTLACPQQRENWLRCCLPQIPVVLPQYCCCFAVNPEVLHHDCFEGQSIGRVILSSGRARNRTRQICEISRFRKCLYVRVVISILNVC